MILMLFLMIWQYLNDFEVSNYYYYLIELLK